MPTYEYRCTNSHTFDQFHKISDAPSTAICPICGTLAERVISGGAGLVFKGSGFYLTDYGKNAHRTSGSGTPAKAEGGETAAKGDTKSEGSSNKEAGAKSEGGASSGSGGGESASSSGSSSGGSSGSSSGGSSGGGGASSGGSSGGAAGGNAA